MAALGKPVVALDNRLNREIAASLNVGSLTLVNSFRDLKEVVTRQLKEQPVTLPVEMRRWPDVAKEYVHGLRHLLEQPQNARKVRARTDLLRILKAAEHH